MKLVLLIQTANEAAWDICHPWLACRADEAFTGWTTLKGY